MYYTYALHLMYSWPRIPSQQYVVVFYTQSTFQMKTEVGLLAIMATPISDFLARMARLDCVNFVPLTFAIIQVKALKCFCVFFWHCEEMLKWERSKQRKPGAVGAGSRRRLCVCGGAAAETLGAPSSSREIDFEKVTVVRVTRFFFFFKGCFFHPERSLKASALTDSL